MHTHLDMSTLATLSHYSLTPRKALRIAMDSLRRDLRSLRKDDQTHGRINALRMEIRVLWPHRA